MDRTTEPDVVVLGVGFSISTVLDRGWDGGARQDVMLAGTHATKA